jgi:hypothetical protein
MAKNKIPGTRHQISSKPQTPRQLSPLFALDAWSLSGAWMLVLDAFLA